MMTIFVMTLGELNYADNFMPWGKTGIRYTDEYPVLFVCAGNAHYSYEYAGEFYTPVSGLPSGRVRPELHGWQT